jgi:carbonic anhydrase
MQLKALIILLSLTATLPVLATTPPHWAYEGQASPEHWGELSEQFQTCKNGQFQSPVDIKNLVDAKLPPLEINFHTDTESIVNNGHTIQITVKDSDDFILDHENFKLMQFHFHTPSENHIKGKAFPLEAHFVHANDQGELAVIAVMFELGEKNPALDPLLAAVPPKINDTEELKQSVNLAALLPSDKHYYRFSGSLTTPPCTEGIRWLVMKDRVTLSEEQLTQFQQQLKQSNNRPLQPLHGRLVVE